MGDRLSEQLAAYAKQAMTDVEKTAARAVMEVFSRIKLRTPVDTGRLRASWTITDGIQTVANPLAAGQYGPEAPPQLSRDRTIVGRSWTIHNPMPYARRIEYGFTGQDRLGRSYQQSPAGMVRTTLIEFNGILRSAGVTFMSEARL